MAAHPIVFRTADRRWRIEADPSGRRFTVERDRTVQGRFTILAELEKYLAEQGISLADLEQD